MKCVKYIKPIKNSKNVEIGEIKRINDIDANALVNSGNWKFVPKSEYKKATRTFIDLNTSKIEGSSEKVNKKKKNTK